MFNIGILRRQPNNNSKGKIKITTDTTTQSLSQNLGDNFFNDDSDPKNRPQINEKLEKGKKYDLSKLIEIYYKYATNEKQKELAEKVFTIANKCKFSVEFLVEGIGFNNGDQQDYDILKISRITTLEKNINRLPNILLHEVIHGITSYAIDAYKNNNLSNENLITAAKELKIIYTYISKNKNLIGNEYGLKNEKETIAELSNPNFRDKLSKIIIGDELKNKLSSNYDKDNITLEDILINTLNKFLDNYDENLWIIYNKSAETSDDLFFR